MPQPLRDFTPKHVYTLLKKVRDKGWGRRSFYPAKTLLSGIRVRSQHRRVTPQSGQRRENGESTTAKADNSRES